MRADDGRGSGESALERVGHGAGRVAGVLALGLLWGYALISALHGRPRPR